MLDLERVKVGGKSGSAPMQRLWASQEKEVKEKDQLVKESRRRTERYTDEI